MRAAKWILAATVLVGTLSTGAIAEDHDSNRGRDRDDAYSQRYRRDRDDVRYYRDGDRDRDDHYRHNWYRGDRDHGRRDRDDHGRGRD